MNITYMKDEELEMIAGGSLRDQPARKGKDSLVIKFSLEAKDMTIKLMVVAKGAGVPLVGRLLESILKGGVISQPRDTIGTAATALVQ